MNREQSFEIAFDSGLGTCRAQCACGKTYYDTNNEWSWEEGELDALDADPNAIGIEFDTGYIEFEGQQFVRDCDCWKERANRLMDFIDGHAVAIAKYLTAERERKIKEAHSAPITEDLE